MALAVQVGQGGGRTYTETERGEIVMISKSNDADEIWRANVLAYFAMSRKIWRLDPATEAQAFTLARAGLPVPATKGEAWDAIQILYARAERDPAPPDTVP